MKLYFEDLYPYIVHKYLRGEDSVQFCISKIMASVQDHLNKLREERIAREKARIEKLRDLNLKKYNKYESQPLLKPSVSSIPFLNKPTKVDSKNILKNNLHVNNTSKRANTAPGSVNRKCVPNRTLNYNVKPTTSSSFINKTSDNPKMKSHVQNDTNIKKDTNVITNKTSDNPKMKSHVQNDTNIKKDTNIITNKTSDKLKTPLKDPVNVKNPIKNCANMKKDTQTKHDTNKKDDKNVSNPNKPAPVTVKNYPKTVRNSVAVHYTTKTEKFAVSLKPNEPTKPSTTRKSLAPFKTSHNPPKSNPNRESVFDRLYKPKVIPKKEINEVEKLRTDPNYLKKMIQNSGLILSKRHTVFERKPSIPLLARRSISAVHFKRINKNELPNCIHKWSSIGGKLDKVHLKEINEDEAINQDKIISAIKSERKKVTFQTHSRHSASLNLNTPKSKELQDRLKKWLQKRGKSMDSYPHLQCFGIHHLTKTEFKPLSTEEEMPKFELYDDENKENVALESDSDNDSYEENMNEVVDTLNNDVIDNFAKDKWRNASYVSDSVDFNETRETTISSEEVMHSADELLLGALNDLTELLREGFDWEQCARWLRVIREHFPSAPESAAYWECRAALEEHRGDLPASVQCWEEAIAKGTEHSVVESNLDHLLDKFMQLKISPNSGKPKKPDAKLLDMKNVFKSTIIRFAVQQAKLSQSNQQEPLKYTVTPVRRSGRLSARWSAKRTPLQVCASIRQTEQIAGNVLFVPNDKLCATP